MHVLNGQSLTAERLILRMPEECWDRASYQTSFCWGACCGDEHPLGSGAVIAPQALPESELERKKGPAQRSHKMGPLTNSQACPSGPHCDRKWCQRDDDLQVRIRGYFCL